MAERLTQYEREELLAIARRAIDAVVRGEPLEKLDLESMPPAFQAQGAAFVTLTIGEQLRGCIGAIDPYQPLALDVQEHAVAAATEDYRFPPVSVSELPFIEIEISRLTPRHRLDYSTPQDLLDKLRPGEDGVVIRDGMRRATFLPQVWEKVPGKEDFLDHLCIKMGARPGLWRDKKLEVFTYQVEEFKEEK